jgi:acyl-coenzyme A thioesterase PaaI-like protein
MGYPGVVHGGILCSLLDEALGWAACVERQCYFVSAELTVRFVKPAPTRQFLTVTARLKETKSRYLISAGEIHNDAGEVFARASGKFFPMTRQESLDFDKQMAYQPGDWKFPVEE